MSGAMRNQVTSTILADDGRTDRENFAAELTEAAYPVALQRHPGKRWLDLQLDLWHAMEQTIEKWQQQAFPARDRRALA